MVPNLQNLANVFTQFVRANSTTILTVTAVAGIVGTVAVTLHEAPKAKQILEDTKKDIAEAQERGEGKKESIIFCARRLVPVVTPIVLTAGLSIASVIGLNTVHTRRYAAMSAAYAIADRSLKEWKEHTAEIVGQKKMDDIKMAIADEKAKNIKPDDIQEVAEMTPGAPAWDPLDICYDSNTGAQFYSSASRIREAFTDLQTELNGCSWVSVNDLYHNLEVRKTKFGESLGWNSGEKIDYDMTYSQTVDGRPCIVLTYTPGPRTDAWGDKYGY